MLNNVEFINKAVTKAGSTTKIDVTYKHLSGKFKGQEWTKGALVPNLDDESKTILKESNKGDVIAVEIEKQGNFYNLTKVRSAQSAQKQKSTYTEKDNVGIKVGAARNQAIAFLAATKGTKFTLDDVDAIAYEIVERQANQENTIRSNANPASSKTIEQEDNAQDLADIEVDTTTELGF